MKLSISIKAFKIRVCETTGAAVKFYRGGHSLRHPYLCFAFSVGGMAANPSIKLGVSKNQTVLETGELGGLWPGDGIFLRSFVLRQFSIV